MGSDGKGKINALGRFKYIVKNQISRKETITGGD